MPPTETARPAADILADFDNLGALAPATVTRPCLRCYRPVADGDLCGDCQGELELRTENEAKAAELDRYADDAGDEGLCRVERLYREAARLARGGESAAAVDLLADAGSVDR